MRSNARQLVDKIATEADTTRDEPMPLDVAGVRPNKSVPVAVRLAPEDAAAIEALAGRLDVPMSALLRGWILTSLAGQREESLSTAIDRIAADVQRLRELTA